MRFHPSIISLVLALIISTSVLADDAGYQVWSCEDRGIEGSWCNRIPDDGWVVHYLLAWSAYADNYDCFGNLVSINWQNNYLTCLTHGGWIDTCSEVMGTGIYDFDCFGYGPTGCGRTDYGTHRAWEMTEIGSPPPEMCLLPGSDKLRGRPLETMISLKDQNKDSCDSSGNEISPLVGNPINVIVGNKYEEAYDIKVSTPGIPVEFIRSYNSQSEDDGVLGYGWTHNYNMRLAVDRTAPTKRIVIWNWDGKALYFNQVQDNGSEVFFKGESGVKDRLKQVKSTGEYFLRRILGNLTFRFAPGGKLTEISDPNGNSLTFSYERGQLIQVSNNFGKTLSIQYRSGRISSVRDPNIKFVEYEYTNGDLTKVKYPDGNSISYSYVNHNMTNKYDTRGDQDPLSHMGHWEYDGKSRAVLYYSHVKDGIQQDRITIEYQPLRTIVTRSTGVTTYTLQFINDVGVIKEIEGCSACGGTIHKRQKYDHRHDLVSVTLIGDDGAEIKTQYVYDSPVAPWSNLGEVLEKTEAVGLSEERKTYYSYTHSPTDPLLVTQQIVTRGSVVDPNNNRTSTTNYDKGNLVSREETGYVLVNGAPTARTFRTIYTYNPAGQLTQIDGPRIDVSDITTLEYYDNAEQVPDRGQPKAIVNALGQRISFSDYDVNGNVGTITDDSNGVVIVCNYDERNRIKTITNQRTTAQIQFSYDFRGNLNYVTPPEGSSIDFTYDLANRMTEIQDTLGNKVIYRYDAEGNLIHEEISDPHEVLKQYLDFTYDAYKRLKKIINPDLGRTCTEYTYDGFGDTRVVRDPRGNIKNYVYDALNRLNTITQTVTMTQPVQVITDYGYDSDDNLILINDPKKNPTQYPTDDFGRRQKTISPDTQTTSYVYDEAGNLTQKADANGTVTNYTYDAMNRLTLIQFPAYPSQNITYTYDSPSVTYGIGRLTGRIDPSGTYTFHYDAQGNLSREEKTVEGILYTTQYTYNKDNILTSITYPTGRTINFNINEIGQVSSVTTPLNGIPEAPLASSITYLPFGGITGFTYGNNLKLAHEYDNQYRTFSITVGSLLDLTYGYDPNGNVTSMVDGIEPTGNVVLEEQGTYAYFTGTNLLDQITGESQKVFDYDQNGNTTTENTRVYVYDALNQLIQVQGIADYVYNGAGQRIEKILPTGTRIFHYDLKGHIIAETDQTGQMLAEYIYLNDQLLAMIRPGENVYYYHNDHLGTPHILTDGSGSIAWKATYTPFGEGGILVETVENPFRFPGQYYDQEIGLHYNYHRYYSPEIGRYTIPDPIGLEGGINLWPYGASNPITRIDPHGLLFGGQLNAGEQYGEAAAFYWAMLSIDPNNTWYETALYDTMGLFASLWTPQTSDATFTTLSVACPVGKWAGRPFWRYVGPKSNPSSPWLTRGLGWKPPYGSDFAAAKNALQMPYTPNGVIPVNVPWYKPVIGPYPAIGHPEWGTGWGMQYYRLLWK